MKVLSTDGLTKLIELIKSAFISVDDTVSTSTVTLATVATSGSYNDLSNKPTIPSAVTESTVSGWGFTKNVGTVTSVNNVQPDTNGNVTISTRNVGEVITSTLPLTDAGLHLLDGARLSGEGIYGEFVQYIADLYEENPSANYFTTEALWQQSVTTYGVCGKFVYDSVNNTVRLPKITGIIEGTTDVSALGDLIEAGLPSHNHKLVNGSLSNSSLGENSYLSYRSDFGGGDYKYNLCGNSNYPNIGVSGEANNSIYGKSNTVQPQTIKGYYYIVVATSTKTDIQVNIDEIATDLNGKADVDLTNCTKPHIVETYVNGTSWYRVYSDGWCEQGGKHTATANTNTTITLIKQFNNTDYNLLLTGTYEDAGGQYAVQEQSKSSRKTSSFVVRIGGYSNSKDSCYWRACGYIR